MNGICLTGSVSLLRQCFAQINHRLMVSTLELIVSGIGIETTNYLINNTDRCDLALSPRRNYSPHVFVSVGVCVHQVVARQIVSEQQPLIAPIKPTEQHRPAREVVAQHRRPRLACQIITREQPLVVHQCIGRQASRDALHPPVTAPLEIGFKHQIEPSFLSIWRIISAALRLLRLAESCSCRCSARVNGTTTRDVYF
jgi:hypothetical protein